MKRNDISDCKYVFNDRVVSCILTTNSGFIIHGSTGKNPLEDFSNEDYQKQAYNSALIQLVDCDLAKVNEEKFIANKKGDERGYSIERTKYSSSDGNYMCTLTLANGFEVIGSCFSNDKSKSDSAWLVAHGVAKKDLKVITNYINHMAYGEEVNNG